MIEEWGLSKYRNKMFEIGGVLSKAREDFPRGRSGFFIWQDYRSLIINHSIALLTVTVNTIDSEPHHHSQRTTMACSR